MTTLVLPNSQAGPMLAALQEAGVRAPNSVTHPTDLATAELTWEPDLSGSAQTTLAAIGRLVVGAVLITPAERIALEVDIDGLRTYHALPTPTAAQTALATKAIIRVLRAILRDST